PAELYWMLAWLFFFTGQYREFLAASERAVALARALQDDNLLAGAMNCVALALLDAGPVEREGRLTESIRLLEEAVRPAESCGELGNLGTCVGNLAWVRAAAGEFAASKQHYQRAELLAERQG